MRKLKIFFLSFLVWGISSMTGDANPEIWKKTWPQTDFNQASVDFSEIRSGGPPKDGIPPIDRPRFLQVDNVGGLNAMEALITISLNETVKAYPLRILMWHEIVNDTLAGVPIAVTYCPLCNAAIVFDRRLSDGRVLDFGTTGKLRHSDLIMYDRQTESWWQQFMGEAIVGEMTGTLLETVPSRLESWTLVQKRYPEAQVLIPTDPAARPYGKNPYAGYSQAARPFLYGGDMPKDIAPMAPVVIVGMRAWSLAYVKERRKVVANGLVIEWKPGQSDALGGATVFEGDDIGNLIVTRNGKDVAHHLSFAFAYHAFHPDGDIVQ